MHRVDDLNYVTNSGKRQFKDSPIPGTTLSANVANAWQEELCKLVEDAGITLMSSAANDQADGWKQVVQAVNRLSHKVPSTFIDVPFDSGSTKTLNPGLDQFAFRLTGSEPDGVLYLYPNTIAYSGRKILIFNDTDSDKYVVSYSGVTSILMKSQMRVYVNRPVSGSDSEWYPLDGGIRSGLTDVEVHANGSPINLGSYTLRYNVENGMVRILFPYMFAVLPVDTQVVLRAYGNNAFSPALFGRGNAEAVSSRNPAVISQSSTYLNGYISVGTESYPEANSIFFQVIPFGSSAATWSSGGWTMNRGEITFPFTP